MFYSIVFYFNGPKKDTDKSIYGNTKDDHIGTVYTINKYIIYFTIFEDHHHRNRRYQKYCHISFVRTSQIECNDQFLNTL